MGAQEKAPDVSPYCTPPAPDREAYADAMEFTLSSEREAIETTRGGLFGGPRDEFRTFVGGPWEHILSVTGDAGVTQRWSVSDEWAKRIDAEGEPAVRDYLATL